MIYYTKGEERMRQLLKTRAGTDLWGYQVIPEKISGNHLNL